MDQGRSQPRLAHIATFFSSRQRMADVVTETEGTRWLPHRQEFERLEHDDPAAAIAQPSPLASDLAQKLALCGRQLTLVDHL